MSSSFGSLISSLVLGISLLLGACLPANASQVLPLTLEDTVQEAGPIFVGRVIGVRSRWGDVTQRWMVTDCALLVEQAIQPGGAVRTGAVVNLHYWGGTIGNETQAIAGVALPSPGERHLLMLRADWTNRGFTPVVALFRGAFQVRRDVATGQDVVVDSEGVALIERRGAIESPPGAPGARQPAGGPVTLDRFTRWLRSNLPRIKARPRRVQRAPDWRDPRIMRPVTLKPALPELRSGTQGLFFSDFLRPLSANNGALLPAIDREAPLSEALGAAAERIGPPPAGSMQAPPAVFVPGPDLPIVVNHFPPGFSWSPEDQYQLSKWNNYADIYRVSTNPTGDFAYRNGRFDLCGFPNSATLESQYGEPWGANTLGICFTRSLSGKIIESDIALNPAFAFTLDDEWVYNGGDGATASFRSTMLHEMGHMWGLQHNFTALSIMNYCPYPHRAYGLPYGDDAAGIRASFPGSAQPRTDLGVYLFYAEGSQSFTDSTYTSPVIPGQYIQVDKYILENLGTTTESVSVSWSLAPQRNFDSLIPLTVSFFGDLTPNSQAPVEGPIYLPVPFNCPPGEYYLLAQLPNDQGASQGSFPFSNSQCWSRTKITVLPRIQELTLNPDTVLGGQPSTATLSLSGPAGAGGMPIALSLDPTGVASVPQDVMVPPGGSAVTFTVNTQVVSDTTDVLVNATGPSGSIGAQLRILRPPPAAPSNLTATVVSATGIELNWQDNSSSETGFYIDVAAGSLVNIGQYDSVGEGVQTYLYTPQTPNQTYYFRVRSYNDGGTSDPSNTASAVAAGIPAVPSNLTIEVLGSTRLILHWQDNSSNEDSFHIQFQTNGGPFVGLSTVPANTTSLQYDGAPNVLLGFKVSAGSPAGISAYSNVATTRLVPAPSNLTAAGVTLTSVKLTWTDNSSFEQGFKVERKEGDGPFQQIATRPADVTTYTDFPLAPCTTFVYRVRAYAQSVNSSPTADATFSSGCVPNAPDSLLLQSLNSNQVTVYWKDKSDNEQYFLVERKTQRSAFKQISATAANDNHYVDAAVLPGIDYTYRVRAANNAGTSDYSNSASTRPLKAPTKLKVVRENLSAKLTWLDQNQTETDFMIERKDGTGSFQELQAVSANVTSFTDAELQACKTYTYRVQARRLVGDSSFGLSSFSNESGISTPCPPNAPSNLSVQFVPQNGGSALLQWKDKSADEDGFEIEMRRDGAEYAAVGTTAKNSQSFLKAISSDCQPYHFRVRAFNVGGRSAWIEGSGIPLCPPAAPTNLVAVRAADGKKVTLQWTDNSNNESVFEVLIKVGGGPFKPALFPSANATTILDLFLKPTLSYSYQIRANNSAGKSALSAVATPPIGSPSALSVTALSSTEVRLNWTDGSSDETAFDIEVGVGAAQPTLFTTRGANATTADLTGLTPSTSYTFRVRARKGANGFSAYTNTAAASTTTLTARETRKEHEREILAREPCRVFRVFSGQHLPPWKG